MGFISHYIMPLVINSLGGGLTHAHTHAHTHTYTHKHMRIQAFTYKAILRNQVSTWFNYNYLYFLARNI